MIKIEYFETKNTINLKNLKNFDTGLALDLFDNDIDDIKYQRLKNTLILKILKTYLTMTFMTLTMTFMTLTMAF